MAHAIETSAEIYLAPVRPRSKRIGVVREWVKVSQFLAWPIVFIVFNIFFKIDIRGRHNLEQLENPTLFISNHIAFYDSFLFRLIIGSYGHLLPLCFMAVRNFKSKTLNTLKAVGIIDLIYSLFGAFTIVPGQGIEAGISGARNIIRDGGNVVIYPEGEMITDGVVGPFKRGAAVLARQTGVTVLPLSFRKGSRMLIRRKIDINIGEPIVVDSRISDIDLTARFRDVVVRLMEE
ncbi:MAG: hypothetical protein A3B11_01955 [Candidatus Taylorbacteria bacterium RIFCSPLOWO2_01_FULL_44_26]|uniref:Phospholipid/glycerol acyltransferase domain-containing protein n=2 Tax=Candidatus Tayloriibacteriota TaxID=1817919 RepID=A0A1G2MJB5_9BACT|nr:MAG: hypothetical protein A3D50_01940 [Candidatus Taylorbacteria bacterium RIFCSPHIGHO2_02_FULL_44_12]OHA31438.1 MAG: hypothetical protein A3B11_01955 [Candidatus Taylorbacteria bacterium RIFCSPLOWO2_01_FULL_44_26]